MTEDFWLPRREGGKGTEIGTLPGGQTLGQIEDVQYFQQLLYKSLGVPVARLDPGEPFQMGFTNEISRDELKFSKFVDRLRNRFSTLFDDLMRIQLVAKKICTEDDWHDIKEKLFYDFLEDNNFVELKEQQLITQRLQILTMITPFVGSYFSQAWVQKHVLHQDDEEIELIQTEIDDEAPLEMPGGGVDPTTGQPIEPAGQEGGGVMPDGTGPGGSDMPGNGILGTPNQSVTGKKPRGEEPRRAN